MSLQDVENVLDIDPSDVNKLRFAPKLGDGATVSTLIKNIWPSAPLKEKYLNDYKKKRCRFYVSKLVRRKFDRDEGVYCIILRFANTEEGPDGVHEYYCRATAPKLDSPGPPNQYFKTATAAQNRAVARTAAVVATEASPDQSDGESDSKCDKVLNPYYLGGPVNDDEVFWNSFSEHLTVDYRTVSRL